MRFSLRTRADAGVTSSQRDADLHRATRERLTERIEMRGVLDPDRPIQAKQLVVRARAADEIPKVDSELHVVPEVEEARRIWMGVGRGCAVRVVGNAPPGEDVSATAHAQCSQKALLHLDALALVRLRTL